VWTEKEKVSRWKRHHSTPSAHRPATAAPVLRCVPGVAILCACGWRGRHATLSVRRACWVANRKLRALSLHHHSQASQTRARCSATATQHCVQCWSGARQRGEGQGVGAPVTQLRRTVTGRARAACRRRGSNRRVASAGVEARVETAMAVGRSGPAPRRGCSVPTSRESLSAGETAHPSESGCAALYSL
jgi:hypothetical protein